SNSKSPLEQSYSPVTHPLGCYEPLFSPLLMQNETNRNRDNDGTRQMMLECASYFQGRRPGYQSGWLIAGTLFIGSADHFVGASKMV
ncbi:MAG: hypothetical protein WCO56_27495, partial [Verrucomicrobiota bacterium]